MIWLAFPAMVIITVRFLIVMANLFTGQRLKDGKTEESPLVSVLIPARNEEHQLPGLLKGLLDQDYENYEILVYNDDSEDGTLQIISEFAGRDKRIKGIDGKGLPEGWSGKNHACHRLAEHASGEYFLFMDADVLVSPGLIRKAIIHARDNNLTLLSIFPQQIMITSGERITVPVMNWILLSLLPLSLISGSHYTSLAAANGQFMLFRARDYRHHRFHRMVRDINVEDIHIMREVKRLGYKGSTLLSGGEVKCRMYRNFPEAIYGFTRSMFAFFGGSRVTLLLFTLFSTFGIFFVWIGMSWIYALVYLFLGLLIRALIASMSRQPVLRTTLFSPLLQLSFLLMVIESFRLRYRGKNIWKGRIIRFG